MKRSGSSQFLELKSSDTKKFKSEDVLMQNHFLRLPLELLTEIFSYFKGMKEMHRLSLVCKQWFEAIESDHGLGFSKKTILKYNKVSSVDDLKKSFRKFVNLKVSNNSEISIETLKEVISFSKVRHLVLTSFNRPETMEILKLLESTLTSLELNYVPWPDNALESGETLNLQHLKSLKISEFFSRKFYENFQNLELLNIEVNGYTNMDLLKQMLMQSQKTINHLTIGIHGEINGKLRNSNFFEYFRNLEKLKHIKLYSRSSYLNSCEAGVILINLPPSVEVIELENVSFCKYTKSIQEHLPNLKDLHFDEVKDLERAFKSPISTLMKTFKYEHGMNYSSLGQMYKNSNLTSLDISGTLMTRDNFTILVQRLPNVKNLCISCLGLQFNEHLGVLSEWKGLRTLTLNSRSLCSWKFEEIDEKSISFPALVELTVLECENVNYFFEKVAFPKLLSLTLKNFGWDHKCQSGLEVLGQIENLTLWCSLPTFKFTQNIMKLKFLDAVMDIEDGIDFVKNISSTPFSGTLDLKYNPDFRHDRDFKTNHVPEIVEKYNKVAENISKYLDATIIKKNFEYIFKYGCYETNGTFELNKGLLDLEVKIKGQHTLFSEGYVEDSDDDIEQFSWI